MKKCKSIFLGELSDISVTASYVELRKNDTENVNYAHVHPECEIYVNLSGDVSFMVEKRIYPIMPGNIVISKPYEYHHCLYHSDKLHKHFWILISLPKSEAGRELFSRFLDRDSGESNLLSLDDGKKDELISICFSLCERELGKCEKYALIFKLLSLIDSAESIRQKKKTYPEEIDTAIDFIDKSFSDSALSVDIIARCSGVSINTLERYFRSVLSISPMAYLKKKRLANAAEMLYHGSTVSEACESSGFSDYSHFISLFKKSYGITPLKYKKLTRERKNSEIFSTTI